MSDEDLSELAIATVRGLLLELDKIQQEAEMTLDHVEFAALHLSPRDDFERAVIGSITWQHRHIVALLGRAVGIAERLTRDLLIEDAKRDQPWHTAH